VAISASRRFVLVLVGALAVGVVGGAIAWACSPQATLSLSATGAPRSGETVTVTGTGWLAPQQAEGRPVEIRWNSPTGPLLAEEEGPRLDAQIVIPADATRGTHWVYGVIERADGTVFARATSYSIGKASTVEVERRGETNLRTSGNSGQAAPAPAAPGSASGRTTGGESPAPAGNDTTSVRGGSANRLLAPSSGSTPASAPVVAPVDQRARMGGSPPATPAASGSVRDGFTTRLTAVASEPARGSTASSEASARADSAGRVATAPGASERTASNDLWSGFSSASKPAAAAAPAVAVSAGGSARTAFLVYGPLGVGLLLVTGGLLAAGRRRVTTRV
jgi:hypothetical protein